MLLTVFNWEKVSIDHLSGVLSDGTSKVARNASGCLLCTELNSLLFYKIKNEGDSVTYVGVVTCGSGVKSTHEVSSRPFKANTLTALVSQAEIVLMQVHPAYSKTCWDETEPQQVYFFGGRAIFCIAADEFRLDLDPPHKDFESALKAMYLTLPKHGGIKDEY